VGPVRQKIIQTLAFVVAIDMAIGVVAVYARNDRGTTVTAAASLSQSGIGTPAGAAGTGGDGGILAGAQFRNRRGSNTPADGTAASAPQTSVTSGQTSSSSTATAPAAGGQRGTSTSAGRGAPAAGRSTTNSTRPASPAPGDPGAPPTTSGPGATVTTEPPVETDPVDPGPAGPAPTPTTATTATTRPKAPSGPKTPKLAIDDRAGDPVIEGTTTPASQPRADLVQTQANYTAKALLLTAKTVDTVQPKDDPRWLSDSTFVSWELDTNGDGGIDYEVQFFFADGGLVAGVSRPGDADSQSVCAAEAGQTADGYTVGIDPGCLGNPASFNYRVTTYYDTDPANENADVITDVTPDGGLSRPVSRP